jgi:CRISPR-associated protein Cmr6
MDTRYPDVKVQQKGKPCLEQSGLLKLSYSLSAPQVEGKRALIQKLFQHLVWLMFHLGGVGQGARRPLYCREKRSSPRPPWYRGTELTAEESDLFQELPETIADFRKMFQEHLKQFYSTLSQLTGHSINPSSLPSRPIPKGQWQDIANTNCSIIVCSGDGDNGKPYALATLHSDDFKLEKTRNGKIELVYDPDLCGKTGDRSPVWIADHGHYQVVTVFGATQNPRKEYLETLEKNAAEYQQIFPFT